MNEIQVSIRCFAYNHERFIRQCLDGFVMQKTDFRFEAIVHDDASTDNTAAIIREYAEKYPDIIKPIYETENQYSKHDGSLTRIMNAHTRGKYIAMCEGDDYWTDPYKLQKQVDFLESHPDYVMCSSCWDEYFENEKRFSPDIPGYVPAEGLSYSLDDLIRGLWCFQPLTVVYRRSALDMTRYSQYRPAKDITLFYLLLTKGKGFCFNDSMAVYRYHSGGVWNGLDQNRRYLEDLIMMKAIYEVEQTKEAASYILLGFTKPISRLLMLKRFSLFWDIGRIFFKQFGGLFTLRLFAGKLLLNKRYSFINDVK